ncbi:MAG: TIGR01777 family oxidoreductase [Gemmatimonadota bacterium]
MATFSRSIPLADSAEEVLAWHGRPGAFHRLKPPWQDIRIVQQSGSIHEGDRLVMEIRSGLLRTRWTALHHDLPGVIGFEDEQVSGPFASWRHRHLVESAGTQESILHDLIEYTLPFSRVSTPLIGRVVEQQLDRLFAYRHRTMTADIRTHRGIAPLRIAIAGASGFVGSNLIPFLTTGGHTVLRLVRRQARAGEIEWNPDQGTLDASRMEGVDAVINLAGENIATRWTDHAKQGIRESRIRSTTLLATTMARLEKRPQAFISVSAVGYYGDTGDQEVDETTKAGDGFLPEIARAWEDAAGPAALAGIRVVHPRFGIILSPAGGALAKMLPIFKLGAGGRLGSGKQWMSWVAMDDVLGSIHHLLTHPSLSGPVNLVSPNPVRNEEFTRVLARVVSRPAIAPVPPFALHLLYGREMPDETLLSGARVLPRRLESDGYVFRFPDLEDALRHVLGRVKE